MSFHVATTKSTLSKHALRDRVHGDKLDFFAKGGTHLVQDLAHRDEFFAFLVNVLLVDLVGHDHDVLSVTHANDRLEVFTSHDLSSGIARVDHDNCARTKAISFGLDNHVVECVRIKAPALALIEIVGQELASVQGQ